MALPIQVNPKDPFIDIHTGRVKVAAHSQMDSTVSVHAQVSHMPNYSEWFLLPKTVRSCLTNTSRLLPTKSKRFKLALPIFRMIR